MTAQFETYDQATADQLKQAYEQAIVNALRGNGVIRGAALEAEIVASANARARRDGVDECDCGARLRYRHGSGGLKCGTCGAFYRTNGQRLR